MAFWTKYAFAKTANSIDSLLNALPPVPASNGRAGSGPPSPSGSADLYERTLDQLLQNADLLSEIKAGTNTRLLEFLARAEVVNRLGGWVVWGLGGNEVEEVLNGGIVMDDVADGPVPDVIVASGTRKKDGMGKVPRRRNMNEYGELEGGMDETAEEKSWAGFPRLATEIIASDVPNLTQVLFEPAAATTQPGTSPTPASFLIPFWESLLRSTELQLETRSVQVGYWARVNGVLLSGHHGLEVLAIAMSIPSLVPRLLSLLPYCSPINDLFILLLRISSPPSHLLSCLVPQVIRMLDPVAPLGPEGHVAADELLRGVIELSSAAPIPLHPPPLNPANGQPPMEEDTWRENGLARQIADTKTVNTLLDWMLVGTDARDSALTPRPSSIGLPGLDSEPSQALRTSSLIQSISVLVDLIRKNNSDFVEQQMLGWARRKEAQESERELAGEQIEGVPSVAESVDRGPCILDLGEMLVLIAERLGGFQELVRHPRSLQGPVATSAGLLVPLTLERFRICEFYAELLHCSNMSLLNRPVHAGRLYDAEGYLKDGWHSVDELAEALKAGTIDEDERDYRPQFSPPMPSRYPLTAASSPVDLSMGYSGASTPSGAGSLDSESGILTRAEAKELRDLLASSAEADHFGDPEETTGLNELEVAVGAIDLDGNLRSSQRAARLPPLEGLPRPPTGQGVELRHLSKVSMSTAPLAPGPLLKRMFMQYRVLGTMLDLFFEFPWNNFLHNVVFDIVQQIFHGRIDRTLDRQLALSVFIDARLIDRILEGQATNDRECAKPRGVRLGYMGHMSLISEETVKLFAHYPMEIRSVLRAHIPAAWDVYVNTVLRATREMDLTPLGGGIGAGMADTGDSGSSSSASGSGAGGLSDEDDEFPTSTMRVLRAMGEGVGGGLSLDEGAFGGHAKASLSTDGSDTGSSDQFSRYLAQAISSDRPDKFGSSDEDDDGDDAGWLDGSARFDPSDDNDFSLSETSRRTKGGPPQFGFEDRFESVGKGFSRRSISPDSDDDADWGPFTTDNDSPVARRGSQATIVGPTTTTAFPSDSFAPNINISPASSGFHSSFTDDDFGNTEFSSPAGALDDDDFGDFEGGTSSPTPASRSIMLPSEEALDDFDLSEMAAESPRRPSFPRSMTAEDGSATFGGLSSSPPSSRPPQPPLSPTDSHSSSSSTHSIQASLATSVAEPLGPSMHVPSHLTADGMVEAEVEGRVVRVPADEIILAHNRRTSIDLEEI